jgi:threonyl-tRNA synthetase
MCNDPVGLSTSSTLSIAVSNVSENIMSSQAVYNDAFFVRDEQGELQTPVMIHRAMLGSIERMMAILTESFGGKWSVMLLVMSRVFHSLFLVHASRPFWLSPRQLIIVPVGPALDAYAQELQQKFWQAGFQAECSLDAGSTLNKKIRQGQLAQFNFIGGKDMRTLPHRSFDVLFSLALFL